MLALLDDDDADLASGYRWRSEAPRTNNGSAFYVVTSRRRSVPHSLYLHRLATGASSGVRVDHINGDGLDNRRANLRLCTDAQNAWNRHYRTGKSKYKGVAWNTKCQKWQVAIKANGRSRYLGLFIDEVEAAKVYDDAAICLFGEFANGNFIKEVT